MDGEGLVVSDEGSIWIFDHDPYGPSWGVREWGMLSQKVSLCHLWRLAQCAIGHHWGRIFSISNYGNYEKRAQVSNCDSDRKIINATGAKALGTKREANPISLFRQNPFLIDIIIFLLCSSSDPTPCRIHPSTRVSKWLRRECDHHSYIHLQLESTMTSTVTTPSPSKAMAKNSPKKKSAAAKKKVDKNKPRNPLSA